LRDLAPSNRGALEVNWDKFGTNPIDFGKLPSHKQHLKDIDI
jgi:hypothetical protein